MKNCISKKIYSDDQSQELQTFCDTNKFVSLVATYGQFKNSGIQVLKGSKGCKISFNSRSIVFFSLSQTDYYDNEELRYELKLDIEDVKKEKKGITTPAVTEKKENKKESKKEKIKIDLPQKSDIKKSVTTISQKHGISKIADPVTKLGPVKNPSILTQKSESKSHLLQSGDVPNFDLNTVSEFYVNNIVNSFKEIKKEKGISFEFNTIQPKEFLFNKQFRLSLIKTGYKIFFDTVIRRFIFVNKEINQVFCQYVTGYHGGAKLNIDTTIYLKPAFFECIENFVKVNSKQSDFLSVYILDQGVKTICKNTVVEYFNITKPVTQKMIDMLNVNPNIIN